MTIPDSPVPTMLPKAYKMLVVIENLPIPPARLKAANKSTAIINDNLILSYSGNIIKHAHKNYRRKYMKVIKLLPGISLSMLIALAACFIESFLPVHVIGAAVIAIFIGMFVNYFLGRRISFPPA